MQEDKSKNVFKEFKTNVIVSIPPQIFTRGNIKPVDILIYIFVCAMSYKKGYCWATTETIQASLNIGSNATVISSIKKLENLNYVRTEKRVSNGVTRRLIFPINQVYESIVNDNRDKLWKKKNNENLLEMINEIDIEEYDWLNDKWEGE